MRGCFCVWLLHSFLGVCGKENIILISLLAGLWCDYDIPWRHPSPVICVKRIKFKSNYTSNASYLCTMCLQGISGALCICYKTMARKSYFCILDFFCLQMGLPADGPHIMPEDCLTLDHHNLLKLYWNSISRHFGRTLKIEICKASPKIIGQIIAETIWT